MNFINNKTINFNTLQNLYPYEKSSFNICVVFTVISFKNKTKTEPETIKPESKKVAFSKVIHSGAGYINPETTLAEKEAEYKEKLEEAIKVGYNILKNGGSSVDAVQKTINVLETDTSKAIYKYNRTKTEKLSVIG